MAVRGVGFFDSRGQFFKTPDEATISDIAAMLGRMGEGEGLSQGIARTLFEKRQEIELLFADHDQMALACDPQAARPKLVSGGDNVMPLQKAG